MAVQLDPQLLEILARPEAANRLGETLRFAAEFLNGSNASHATSAFDRPRVSCRYVGNQIVLNQ